MKTINHHLICPFQRHRWCAFLISSLSKGRGRKESVFHGGNEPHRGSAFDSPGLPNDSAGYPGLIRSVGGTTPSVLRFFNFICWNSEHKIRTHSYSKKTQHRWRCSFAYICRQGNSLRSPTLPYKERNPYGVRQSVNFLCARSPF